MYKEVMVFVPLGLAVVGLLMWLGPLRRQSLDRVPRRDVGLDLLDLFVAVLLTISAALIVQWMLQRWWTDEESDVDYVVRQWLGAAAMLPMTGYVIWRVRHTRHGLRRFGLLSRRPVRRLAIGGLALLAAWPIVSGVGVLVNVLSLYFVEPPQPVQHEMLEVFGRTDSTLVRCSVIILAVLIMPIIEEIAYRGLLQTSLLSLNGVRQRWSVVLIASCWFTLAHATVVPWQALPSLFVLGMFLGWLYERTGSLWPSITLHMSFNALNVALTMFLIE